MWGLAKWSPDGFSIPADSGASCAAFLLPSAFKGRVVVTWRLIYSLSGVADNAVLFTWPASICLKNARSDFPSLPATNAHTLTCLPMEVHTLCTHRCLYIGKFILTYAPLCWHVYTYAHECAGMCAHRYNSLHSLLTDRWRNAICTFLLKWKIILKYLLWKIKSAFDPLRLRKASTLPTSPPRWRDTSCTSLLW